MDPQKVVLWSAGKSSVIYEKSLGSTALLTPTLKKSPHRPSSQCLIRFLFWRNAVELFVVLQQIATFFEKQSNNNDCGNCTTLIDESSMIFSQEKVFFCQLKMKRSIFSGFHWIRKSGMTKFSKPIFFFWYFRFVWILSVHKRSANMCRTAMLKNIISVAKFWEKK